VTKISFTHSSGQIHFTVSDDYATALITLLQMDHGQDESFKLEQTAKIIHPPKKHFDARPKDFDEFKIYCTGNRGMSEKDTLAMFAHAEANGWTIGGKPMKNWKAWIVSWQTSDYLPSQRKAR